jgi:hypothetical protein
MGRYFDRMRDVVERHGGTVEKFIGDAVMAVFGVPTLHEDDALRAVRAALDMREAVASLSKELERDLGVTIATRTGVTPGEIVAGDPSAGQRLATGDAVNVAARLEQAAGPGEILIGDQTFRLARAALLVEEVEPLALKGKEHPVPAHRVVEVAPDVKGFERRLDSPMVGREDELSLLEGTFRRATHERIALLFTVLGSAGVGEPRLVQEFIRLILGGRHGGAGPLPGLRRGDHVLAGDRDREADRPDHGARLAGRGPGPGSPRCSATTTRQESPQPGSRRPSEWWTAPPPRGGRLGRVQAPGGNGPRPAGLW